MFPVERNESTKSYDKRRKKTMKELVKRATDRSYAKCEFERRICSSPSAVPPSVFLSVHFLVRRKSAWRFSFGDIDFRPSSFERDALLDARVKDSQYRGSWSEFSKPRIKRRIELYERRRERDRGGGWGRRGSGGRPREEVRKRTNARIHSTLFKRGGSTAIIAAAAAVSVGYDDEVIPSSLP